MLHRFYLLAAVLIGIALALPVAGAISSAGTGGLDTKCPKCCAACMKKETRFECQDCVEANKGGCNPTQKTLCEEKCEDIGLLLPPTFPFLRLAVRGAAA